MKGLSTLLRSPRRLIALLLAIVLLVLIAVAFVDRVDSRLDPEPARPTPPVAVETITVEPTTFLLEDTYRGSVETEQRATIAARVSARVLAIEAREGASVQAGDVLFRLDAEELQLETDRLDAVSDRLQGELETAERELARQERLHGREMVSERAVDNARQRVATLEAQLRETRASRAITRARLDYTVERAPFDGRIQVIHREAGEMARPGEPVLELVSSAGRLRAMVTVPEQDVARLEEGMVTRLSVPALSREWPGEVDAILPALDTRTRSAGLLSYFPPQAGELVPGMAVRVTVVRQQLDNVIAVPAGSVHRASGVGDHVFLVEDGRARRQTVTAAERSRGRIRITEGLAFGDRLIVGRDPRLTDDVAVRDAGEDRE